jgi:uncharacterized surface protein with fasciclin (FAS1) repeats
VPKHLADAEILKEISRTVLQHRNTPLQRETRQFGWRFIAHHGETGKCSRSRERSPETRDECLRISSRRRKATFASPAVKPPQPIEMETLMSKRFALFAGAAVLAVAAMTSVPTYAQSMSEKTVTVGGAPMYPSKNIVQNAVNSKDHTTLVAAVKAAGLVDTLSGPGPFTVFAPTNAAFAKLPAGTVDNLLKPENKATLVKVLTYHVVPGRMTAANLMKAVKDGEGEAHLKTVAGEDLTVKQAGPGKLTVTDSKGDVAMVTIADVLQSNGVIHVIDTVLLP